MSFYRKANPFRLSVRAAKPTPTNAEKFVDVRGNDAYKCLLCGNAGFSMAGIKAHLTPTGQGNKNCQKRRESNAN